jgi:hypothetical protein
LVVMFWGEVYLDKVRPVSASLASSPTLRLFWQISYKGVNF